MSEKKTVGIITMHKVLNYGSLLQAFALQEYIASLGYDVQIIDYKYPNKYHKKFSEKPFWYKLLHGCFNITRKILYLPLYGGDWGYKSKKFWKANYKLSKFYKSSEHIKRNPPKYDIYVTGSDQVWNTDFSFGDDVYMCSFVPIGNPKISYGASVAKSDIPSEYIDVFRKNLLSYSAISLRDKKCTCSLGKLLDKNVETVCDPVFLQSEKFYSVLADKSKLKINGQYILVYLLDYMFNPFPSVVKIINELRMQKNLPVYFMWGKRRNAKLINADKVVYVPSVEDFIFLIKNASLVITNSFHGTALAIIFRRQFYSIVKMATSDSRIFDLLETLNLSDRTIALDSEILKINEINWFEKEDGINAYINESKDFLSKSLISCEEFPSV